MIVHLLIDEKFTSEFMDLVDSEFNNGGEHVFLLVTKHDPLRYEIRSKAKKVLIRNDMHSLFSIIMYLLKANKIILHGLFNPYLTYLLFLLPVAHKVIWAIWGGDLYNYKNERGLYKYAKKTIIKRFCGVTTPVDGDVELARKVYGFKGKYYPSMLYLSNVVKELDQEETESKEKYTVLVGNSADDSNRHDYILEKLKRLNTDNVRFILPLSYGSQIHADKVENEYKAEFGENALCLRSFMPKDEYIKLLSEVDVVLFAHNRQQGVGNIMQLINIGAKVYLEPYVTTYMWLRKKGINVYSIEDIDENYRTPLSRSEKEHNRKIVLSFASREKLIKQLRCIFEE